MSEVEDKIITPEVQKRLDAIKGFTNDSTFIYVPKICRDHSDLIPKSNWPIFKLKGRDGLDQAHAEDSLSFKVDDGKTLTNSGALRISILQKHILGWKNWLDKNDNPIKFVTGTDGVQKKLIGKMSGELQMEILTAINEHSHLTDEEKMGLEF